MAVLGDEPRPILRGEPAPASDLAHRAADLARHIEGEVHLIMPAGHVRDVDAPAVGGERLREVAAHDGVRTAREAAPQHRVALVELGEARHVEPRDVAVGVVGEQVEAGLGGVGIGLRVLEPLMGRARVVRSQVEDQAHAALVHRVGEAHEGLVPAEQGIDAVERRGVVAVHRARGEDRREVHGVRAERPDVIEAVDDPVEIAAEELPARDVAADGGLVVPAHRDGPRGQVDAHGRQRAALVVGPRVPTAREAVGEDLVDHGVVDPRGRVLVEDQAEVRRVRDVPRHEPGCREPRVRRHIGPRRADEAEAVRRHGVRRDDGALPPPARLARLSVRVLARHDARGDLAVDHAADRDRRHGEGRRDPQADLDAVAQRRRGRGHAERAGIVEGLLRERDAARLGDGEHEDLGNEERPPEPGGRSREMEGVSP